VEASALDRTGCSSHFEVLFEMPICWPSTNWRAADLPGGGFMGKHPAALVQKQTPNANPVHRWAEALQASSLFAKTAQAAAQLGADWNTSRIEKIYRALAQGIAEHDAYENSHTIGLVPHPRIGSVWAANASGRPSKSLAKVIHGAEHDDIE